MKQRVMRMVLAGSLLLSMTGAACNEADRPETEDVERGVEKGAGEIEQQVEEGVEDRGEGK